MACTGTAFQRGWLFPPSHCRLMIFAPYSLVRTGMIGSNPYPGLPLHFGIVLDGGQPGSPLTITPGNLYVLPPRRFFKSELAAKLWVLLPGESLPEKAARLNYRRFLRTLRARCAKIRFPATSWTEVSPWNHPGSFRRVKFCAVQDFHELRRISNI